MDGDVTKVQVHFQYSDKRRASAVAKLIMSFVISQDRDSYQEVKVTSFISTSSS